MPLVRIDHAAGKPPAYRAAISKSVHHAMTSTFTVPDDDRFQIIGEHAPGTAIVHAPSYRGIEYSDELVIIQITCNEGRTLDQETPVCGPRRQSRCQSRPAAGGCLR